MTDTETTAPKPPGRFDFHEARATCQDVLDALAAQGLTARIDNLSGGCAGIRIMLPDGTAILISDLDGSFPADRQAACGWIAEHTAWQDGPTGYPGEPVTNIYESTAPGDDTAAMLAAVSAYARTRRDTNHHQEIPMTTEPFADLTASANAVSPAADLVRALIDSGWAHTEDSAPPAYALRPADDCDLTLWVAAEADGAHLLLDAGRRRLGDGTIRPPWRAEVYGALPVEVLTAVAAANAADCHPEAQPGDLLAPAGWNRSPVWGREWAMPDQTRELVYIDDDPDNGDMRWCVQRYDLETEVAIANDAPATVIAAFALTDAS